MEGMVGGRSTDSMDRMDDADASVACDQAVRPSERAELSPLRTAFIEHLKYGHGVLKMPDGEMDAWWLHQQIHGR
jgi:hypothetical protein